MQLVHENVQFTAKHRSLADPVNVRIDTDQTFALVGPSHAGKSAMLLAGAGYMRPTVGSVYLLEDPFDEQTQSPVSPTQVSMGPIREFSPLFDTLTVREHVMYQLRLLRQRSVKRRAAELLETYDLRQVENVRVKDLDHFAYFRASLAVTVASRPRFVLLDEPLMGLTKSQCTSARDYFHSLNSDGTGVMFSTVLASVDGWVDGIVLLPEGEVRLREDSVERPFGRVEKTVAK